MILILSEHDDVSTDKVCLWLNYYKAKYIRINTYINHYDIFGNVKFENEKLHFELIINEKTYNLDEITVIWCRRGYINFTYPTIEDQNYDGNIYEKVKKHLNNETATLESFFEFLIEQKFHINNKNHYNSNKLIALYLAQKHGLKIPDTLITRNAAEIQNFLKTEKQIITKNIQDVLNVKNKEFLMGQATSEVFEKDIKNEQNIYSQPAKCGYNPYICKW